MCTCTTTRLQLFGIASGGFRKLGKSFAAAYSCSIPGCDNPTAGASKREESSTKTTGETTLKEQTAIVPMSETKPKITTSNVAAPTTTTKDPKSILKITSSANLIEENSARGKLTTPVDITFSPRIHSTSGTEPVEPNMHQEENLEDNEVSGSAMSSGQTVQIDRLKSRES